MVSDLAAATTAEAAGATWMSPVGNHRLTQQNMGILFAACCAIAAVTAPTVAIHSDKMFTLPC